MHMMPFQVARNVRSLNRLRHIVQVLTGHGFGHVFTRMNLGRFVPVWMARRTPADAEPVPESIGRRLAQAFTELGPTFIKLGQMLSTRPDILPDGVIQEFRKLQDHVPPFDTATAMEIVAEELGRPVAECFRSIEGQPMASASISQVFRAVSKSGEKLCVKVRRPGIEEILRTDMELLRWMAESMESFLPELRIYRPAVIVSELEQTVLRELDFVNEASVTERFYRAFNDDPGIHIPKVHWELTGKRVLTIGMLRGVNVGTVPVHSDVEDLARVSKDIEEEDGGPAPAADFIAAAVGAGVEPAGTKAHVAQAPRLSPGSAGYDGALLAHRLADCFLKQTFELGLFHADPHPGNILVEPPANIGLIDFGQIGSITDEWKTELVIIVYATVNREIDVVIETFADMGAVTADTDRASLHRSLRFLLDKYYGLPIKRFDLSVLLREFSEIIRKHDVILPRDFVLLIKSFSTVSAIITRLDPELNLLALLQPRLKKALGERFSARTLARETAVAGWHLLNVARQAPGQLRQVMRRVATGGWRLDVRHQNIDRLISELDRSSNRLAFSIVIAAIIVGSSVVLQAEPDLKLFGFIPVQAVGVLGYCVAGVMGLGLAWAIFRSGRLH